MRWASAFQWPVRHVPAGGVGVVLDWRSGEVEAGSVVGPGWHFVSTGRMRVMPTSITTGEVAVPARTTNVTYRVAMECAVVHPEVAVFAVADLCPAIRQQIVTGVRSVTLEQPPSNAEQLAVRVRELLEPILSQWGVSVERVTATFTMDE